MERQTKQQDNSSSQQVVSCKTYVMGLLVVLLTSGYCYGLFTPQSLETPLRQAPYELSSKNYQLIFVFTFMIAMVFITPLGILIDKIPLQYSLILVLLLSLSAEVGIGWAFQEQMDGYIFFVYAFRGVFGLAGVGLSIVKGVFFTKYAKEHYQVLMGVGYFVPAIFFGFNSYVTTNVYSETNNVPLCFYIAAGVCGISLISGVILIFFFINPSINQEVQSLEIAERQSQIIEQLQKGQTALKQQKVSILKRFKKAFWIVVLANFLSFLSYISLIQNFHDMMVKNYGISYEIAGIIQTITNIMFFIVAVLLSLFSKRYPQHRRKLLLIISIYFTIVYFLLYSLQLTTAPTTKHYLFLLLFLLGLVLIYNSTLFIITFISYVVEEEDLGLAWSINNAAICVSQFLGSISSIFILNQQNKSELPGLYHILMLYFGCISLLPIILNLYINTKEFQIFDETMLKISSQKQIAIQRSGRQIKLKGIEK